MGMIARNKTAAWHFNSLISLIINWDYTYFCMCVCMSCYVYMHVNMYVDTYTHAHIFIYYLFHLFDYSNPGPPLSRVYGEHIDATIILTPSIYSLGYLLPTS